MTFLVTAVKPSASAAAQATDLRSIHDTDQMARDQAERYLKEGYREVAIWKQIATPRIEQTVVWEGIEA